MPIADAVRVLGVSDTSIHRRIKTGQLRAQTDAAGNPASRVDYQRE